MSARSVANRPGLPGERRLLRSAQSPRAACPDETSAPPLCGVTGSRALRRLAISVVPGANRADRPSRLAARGRAVEHDALHTSERRRARAPTHPNTVTSASENAKLEMRNAKEHQRDARSFRVLDESGR